MKGPSSSARAGFSARRVLVALLVVTAALAVLLIVAACFVHTSAAAYVLIDEAFAATVLNVVTSVAFAIFGRSRWRFVVLGLSLLAAAVVFTLFVLAHDVRSIDPRSRTA